MLAFALFRLTFLLLYLNQTFLQYPGESFASFIYALRLDASAVAYCIPVTLLVVPFTLGKYKSVAIHILQSWFIFLYIVFALMAAGDILVQDEWGSKLHYTAIKHLEHPTEAARTGTGWHFLVFFGSSIFFLLFVIPFNKWIHKPFSAKKAVDKKAGISLAISSVLMLGTCFVVGRGGFQAIAINVSQSYFSQHQILNNAAVNTPWSVVQSIVEGINTSGGNPYSFHKNEDLKKIAQPLLAGNQPQKGGFLNTDKPNIVLFILESWSDNAIFYEENGRNPTPYFKQLISEGWYWSNTYTVGWKSDFGVPGILSAWPCHELGSICSHPSKCAGLPGIAQSLKSKNYSTEFIYGGQLIYGNLKSYVYQTGYDQVVESDNLPNHLNTGRLGVQDDELLQYTISEINAEKTFPFFKAVYTLSSHPPFDHPNNKNIFKGNESEYLNSLVYSDDAIKHFIEKAKAQPWFNNTIFIFTADHGRAVPGHDIGWEPDFFRIPVLFWGPALDSNFIGKKYEPIASQTDITPTLLQELNINTDDYPFGRNIFHPDKQDKAFITFCGGFIVVGDKGNYGYDIHAALSKDYLLPEKEKDTLKNSGEAYLQYLMEEFLKR
jgi:phosphoglycerol transferase MdoB-like AlkP superfamily enzyme